MPDHEYLLVSITTSSPEEAERIAEALVQERLAACVNIVPAITSIYRWQGEVHMPEIIALPIVAGSKAYLSWIDESVKRGEELP
jgi:periplasmic divalent cation tolerance protein